MSKRTPTIVGKWRITGISTWDRAYIDLVGPGFITFATREMGEMAFGVVTATLDCTFNAGKTDVGFEFTVRVRAAPPCGLLSLGKASDLKSMLKVSFDES